MINKILEWVKKLPEEFEGLHWVWKFLIIIAIFCLLLKSVLSTVLLLAILIRLIFVTKDRWSKLLIASLFACILFLSTPQLLKIGFVYNLVDSFFSGLQYSDYKSSVIESIGGMLGTFLAIIGALWTQHYFEQEEERKTDIQNATVIYYDFKFAFREIQERLKLFCCEEKININELNPDTVVFCNLVAFFSGYRILIDSNWISNVAKLPSDFTAQEIEHIYNLYGLINSINISLDSINHTQEKYSVISDTRRVSDLICEFYAVSPIEKSCEIHQKYPELQEMSEITLQVYKKLSSISAQRSK